MDDRNILDFKIRQFYNRVLIYGNQFDLVFQLIFAQARQYMADGEISRIDGAAQARPDVGDGTEVVFMRMGYKHCVNAVAIAFQPGRISQPQFHAGEVVIQKS